MNIRQEILKRERQKNIKEFLKKGAYILKSLLCTHSRCEAVYLNMDLGNCENSILKEVWLDLNPSESHLMRVKLTRCIDCGRIIAQDIIEEIQPTMKQLEQSPNEIEAKN